MLLYLSQSYQDDPLFAQHRLVEYHPIRACDPSVETSRLVILASADLLLECSCVMCNQSAVNYPDSERQLIGLGSIWMPSGVYHTQVITGIGWV